MSTTAQLQISKVTQSERLSCEPSRSKSAFVQRNHKKCVNVSFAIDALSLEVTQPCKNHHAKSICELSSETYSIDARVPLPAILLQGSQHERMIIQDVNRINETAL
jgi:hypothetical protein